MIDIKFLRENPEAVKQNIRNTQPTFAKPLKSRSNLSTCFALNNVEPGSTQCVLNKKYELSRRSIHSNSMKH